MADGMMSGANTSNFYVVLKQIVDPSSASRATRDLSNATSKGITGGLKDSINNLLGIMGGGAGGAIGSKFGKLGSVLGIALGSGVGSGFGSVIAKKIEAKIKSNIWAGIPARIAKAQASIPSMSTARINSPDIQSLITSKVGGEAANKMNMLASSLNKVRAGFIGIAAAIAVLTPAVMKFSDFNEELNKTKVLFRDATHMATKFADTMASAYGTSKTDALKLVSDVQNTLIPFMSDSKTDKRSKRTRSAEMSIGISQRVMDIASLRNMDVGETATLMTSAIIRGGRAAQSLGASMTAAEVESRAMAMSHKQTAKSLTIEDKIMARIAIMKERTADADEDMLRTAGSIANAWRGIKGTGENFLSGIGELVDTLDLGGAMLVVRNILTMVTHVVSAIAKVLKPNRAVWQSAWGGVNVLLTQIIEKFGKLKDTSAEIFRIKLPKNLGKGYFDKMAAEYKGMATERKALLEKQSNNPKNRYANEIASTESLMRYYSNMLELFGKGDLIEKDDPFKNTNSSLEEMDKLTSSISDNIASINDTMQEAAFKSVLPDLSNISTYTPFENEGMYASLMKSNVGINGFGKDETGILALREELQKHTFIFQQLLDESKRGTYR